MGELPSADSAGYGLKYVKEPIYPAPTLDVRRASRVFNYCFNGHLSVYFYHTWQE